MSPSPWLINGMSVLVRLCGLVLLALALGSAPASAERRVALVVGNSSYKSINQLANPKNDASDVAAALEKLGFEVLLRKDLDKGSFGSALAEFARRSSGADAALFYYAGHGIQYQRQNYLLPTDIEVRDYEDVEFQSVSLSRVMDALKRSDGVRIIILDACRDNPLDKLLSGRGLQRYPGLAPVDKAEGLVVAYATAADQVAQDGAGRNSPFTEALVRRLGEPGMEIATLFRRVSQDVFERTRGQQRPEISISLLRDFYLNAADSDTGVWGKIRNSYELADFVDFLRRFPSSPLASEAQARIDFIQAVRRQAEAQAAVATARDRAAAEDRERQAAAERDRLLAEARAREDAQARAAADAVERERVAALVRERAATLAREKTAAEERERQAAAERQRLAEARAKAQAEEKARAEAAERERLAALARDKAAAEERDRAAAAERQRLAEAKAKADAEEKARAAAAERERVAALAREKAAAEERERQAALERERAAAAERQKVAEEKARAETADRERVAALVRERAETQAREKAAADERQKSAAKAAAEKDQAEAVRREVERLAALRQAQTAQRAEVAALAPAEIAPATRETVSPADAPMRDENERRAQKEAYEQRQRRREALAIVRARGVAAGLDVTSIDAELRELDRLDVVYVARLRKEAGAQTR